MQECPEDIPTGSYSTLGHAFLSFFTLCFMQERPEDIPTGELPRTLLLVADRRLCNQVTPGTRVTIIGIYSTFKVDLGLRAMRSHRRRNVTMLTL